MANFYIQVGSITNAMRGKRLLEEQGIHSYLHRTSHLSAEEGCGYSILVTEGADKAAQILQKRGVRVINVTKAM